MSPSASDESREEMRKMFGDPVSPNGPYRYLKDKGYVEDAGMLKPPKSSHLVTTEEWACISFLCDEWDYGFDPDLPI